MAENNENRSTERAKASVKEAIGKLIGDVRVEAEGKAEKTTTPPPPKPRAPRRS